MDIQKEKEAFERHKAKQLKIDYVSLKNVLDDCERRFPNNRYAGYSDFNRDFETWLAAKAQAVPECTWSRNEDWYFDTSCGNSFMFTECEDTPSEHQFSHCCYCGGKLIEAQELAND